jgi:hypothetical protein
MILQPQEGHNNMPDGIGTIDWVGLNEALSPETDNYVSIDPEDQVDIEGLNKALGFGLVEQLEYKPEDQVDVKMTPGSTGTPWYESVFSDLPNWTANRLMDAWYYTMAFPTLGASLIPLKDRIDAYGADEEDIQRLAAERKKQFEETDFAPEIHDFFTSDLPKGVEAGAVQFLELMMGGKAETIQDKIEKLEIAGLIKEYRDGNTTDEDFQKEIKWYQDRAENIPLARDIVAGITNSLFIMGSLAATGGIHQFTTRGLKIGSRAWMKAWGQGMLQQGKNTWKLMGLGATIGAMNEAVQEENLAQAKGEEFTFWDFMAEIGKNQVTKHSQAFLEGMSEGVLLGMPMGGINMTKWLGKPISRTIKIGGKSQEVVEHLGTNKIRKLMNAAKTPELKKYYAKNLAETIADRKAIGKNLAQNFGKKLANGLFVETFTEQITDAANDIMTGSHSNAIWLALGDDEQKHEALRNLIVEASVGVFLGFGVGISDTWKRDILKEIERDYGVETAREVEKNITGQKERELKEKLNKAKGDPNVENPQAAEEAAKDITVQDQGSGNHIPLVQDDKDEEVMEEVKKNNASLIADVIAEVGQLEDPNILDYTFAQGKEEINRYLFKLSERDSKKPPIKQSTKNKQWYYIKGSGKTGRPSKEEIEQFQNNKPLNYTFSSYMTESTIRGNHAMNEKIYKGIVKEAIERGVVDKTKFFVSDDNAALAKDLAVGVMLNFDQDGWNYVKHKWSQTEGIDFAIEQANELRKSKAELKPNKKFLKLKGPQNIGTAQFQARRTYKKIIGEHIAMLDQVTAGPSSVQFMEDFEAEDILADQEYYSAEVTDLPDDFDDSTQLQTANVAKAPTKAQAIADLAGVQLKNSTVMGDISFYTFVEPVTGMTFTVDNKDLAYNIVREQATRIKFGIKMEAVAFKGISGKIYRGEKGETHGTAQFNLWDEGTPSEPIVDGFVDAQGKFYTREEAQEITGLLGESFSQGVADGNLRQEVQFQDAPINLTNLGKYSRVTDGFSGRTVSEFLEHLIKQKHIGATSSGVVDALLHYVGDKNLVIDPTMQPENPAKTVFPGNTIHINPNATLWHTSSVFDSLAHEMTHSYLHEFMRSGTPNAQAFNGKVRGVRNMVRKVLQADAEDALFQTRFTGTYAELRAWYSNPQHKSLIQKALSSDEEFMASVFSDTQFVKWITDRVSVGGAKGKMTGWRKIVNEIANALKLIGVTRTATEELFDIMERSHTQIVKFQQGQNRAFSPRLAKEQRRLNKNVTSGYIVQERNDDDETDDQADPGQEWDELEDEGESQLEKASIENFISAMAEVWGVTEPEYREYLKELDSFDSYLEDFTQMDKDNSYILTKKIEHLYKGYHKTFKTIDEFKKAFLKRKYLNVVKKNAKPGYIFVGIKTTNVDDGNQGYHYEMRKVKDVYRDGNGKKRNTYRRNTVLEGFVPILEKKLGLPAGTLKISYIESFEQHKNGKINKRTNLARLDKYMLGKDDKNELPLTQNLANMIWDAPAVGATSDGMLYIGNFGGKNTLPILTFKREDRKLITKALDAVRKDYHQAASDEFGTDYSTKPSKYKKPQEYGSLTRAILEELWFKWDATQAAKADWNKMMKRAPKWNAEDTGIVIDQAEFEAVFGNAPINGMTMDGNDILVNAHVVSSTSQGTVSFEGYDGEQRDFNIQDLMLNELGTSTIDGASFYIIGHFDKAYSLAHGTLKSGALKNVYSSHAGEDPLFLKHAMHGVSADSPLGRIMIKNNAAVLIADESMKEGPADQIQTLDELNNKTNIPPLKLKMSQFSRHSESQYDNFMSGATKQLMNGTSFSDLYNEILSGIVGEGSGLNEILTNLSNNIARQTTEWFQKNSTPEAIHNILRDIVYNPKSPQEEKVSRLWIDLIEPKEGQKDENVRKKYFGAWQHAHTAEVVRARMQFKLNEMLAGKIPGARAVLQNNGGWANDVNDIQPITTNYNLAHILISGKQIPAKVKQAAFPEAGLLTHVQFLQELQKQEQRAHNLTDKDEKRTKLKEIAEGRAITIDKIKQLDSDRLKNIVTSKTSTLSPHTLVNWAHPSVQAWKEDVVWGVQEKNDEGELIRRKDGILDIETGRLRQGWAILSEDQADELGVKPGDWIVAVITPTDSPLGVIGVRVASIVKTNSSKSQKGRKTSDNSKAIFNSEWVQTMAGKDFDIDTISLLTYDERYWTRDDFNRLATIASQIPKAYSQEVAKETRKLFKEKGFVPKNELGEEIKVTSKNVFKEDVIREAYSILMNGVPKARKRQRFSIMGDSFMELDNAYLHDPAPIINERLHHTAASALNMRAKGVIVPFINNKNQLVTKFTRNGKTEDISVDFNVRNKDWLRLHINHLHMTNAEVDFPNKTTRLSYLSDPRDPAYKRKMGMYFWGLGDAIDYKHVVNQTEGADRNLKINNLEHIFDALKSFQKLLFDDAFQLARGRNSVTFEKLDYFDTAQQIKKAQNILKALDSGKKEHLDFLVGMWVQKQERARDRAFWPDTNRYKTKTRQIRQQKAFLQSFVANLQIDDVYAYPLFNAIKNINLNELIEFMPGNIYKDHLINQVLASLETISYYPDLELLYEDQIDHMDKISHRSSADGNVYLVSERIARKPAQRILSILGMSPGDPRRAVADVRFMINDKKVWADRVARLGTPAEVDDLQEAVQHFNELEARVGKAFQPFERDGELINVDTEVITMSRMLQSLDALEGRITRRQKEGWATYWRRQIRGFRYEVNQLIHAFDERGRLQKGRHLPKPHERRDPKKHVSQVLEQQRAAASATYPILFKQILNTEFLQFADLKKRVTMRFSGEDIIFSNDGAGQLLVTWRGNTWNHNEINEQKTPDTRGLYKMLTQRSVGDRTGFWEGVEDSRQGTWNRKQLGDLMSLSANITMEAREEILIDYIGKNLYESNRGFTSTDQKAFWVGMLAQTSDQGIQDRKATGMIVNQTIYDKRHPFKFQSNHLALTLLGNFEPEIQSLWMQLYSVADRNRSPQDRAHTVAALRDGRDSTVEMLYQDAPVGDAEDNAFHFFSDYVKEHKSYTKDKNWLSFYKFTRDHTWAESLARLRSHAEGLMMLKALSENGVYYEDLVKDLKTLGNKQFMEKYKHIDLVNLRLALERYSTSDFVGQFIRQRAGESDVAFRTRSNLLVFFYQLNSAMKREGARNRRLTFIRKMASNIMGYDIHAILREKKTRIFDHKDEPIGFIWDTDGTHNFTVGDAVLAIKTHATRTFQGVGESIVAITKGQHINRTLATHQVTLNNAAKNYEDVVNLMTDQGYRDSYRVQFEHQKKDKRTPHDDRSRFIVDLLDQILPEHKKQKEIRRQQVFSLAEDLLKDKKVFVRMGTLGALTYNIMLGGKKYSYESVRELINAHFNKLSPIQKLSLVGAIDIRVMYDIHVPEFLEQMVSYLDFTREHLAETASIDASLKVDAMMDKYTGMLDMIKINKGNYMPHQFPVARYKQAWMKGYLDHAVKDLERKIAYHKKNKHNIYLAQLDLKKDKLKIREMAYAHAEKVWDSISHDWGQGALIPNFIPRKMPDATGYTKTDPTIHFNYITKLIKGLKNDALYADWLIYQSNARAAGERHSTMEITRRWYGDQIGDQTLRSVNQKWSDIKPGQQIHFDRQNFVLSPGSSTGYFGNVTVSGVVKKITDDEVFLNVDTDATSWHARMALKKWNDRLHTWEAEGRGQKLASQKLVATLQNLIKKQVLDNLDFAGRDLTKMTARTAAEFIILGHERILKTPEMIGRYKKSDIWGEDIMGNPLDGTVNIYRGQGAIERLEAKKTALKNLQLLGDDYTGAIPKAQYRAMAITHGAVNHLFGGFKKLSGLFYMGLASAGPARFTNQMGAIVNNLIDSPLYNIRRWKEGNKLWTKIKHGQLEQMTEAEQRVYTTVVGLGLTEDNNILAIALEAANISPEDMLLEGSKIETIKWLAKLFKDATKYDSTYKRLESLTHQFNLNNDPIKRMEIQGEILDLKRRWKAKMHGLLSDTAPVGPQLVSRIQKDGKPALFHPDGRKATSAEIKAFNKQIATERELFQKANELARKNATMNIAEEQGFTKNQVLNLFAKVAWKGFFTSSIGMGFQAKAEKMRIPAFFIGYTTAIRMGFDEEEALQLAVNSVELRHAFYGAANKQFGANTKVGSVGFQYAQYQYNAISKAVRIMREAIPQMIGFASNKQETDSNLKHAMKMLKLVQNTVDSKGKQLMRPGTKISLKEINLMHGILMKIGWTALMMQVGTRIFYGLTNIQDPVGQMVYRQMDFLFDVFAGETDFGDDDDWDELSYAIQDMALPLGLLYKLGIQSMTSMPQKGFNKTFLVGRVDNTFDFSWRLSNTLHLAAYQLGATDEKPHEKDEIIFDLPWITDDFTTGVKLTGWTSGSSESVEYDKRGLYYGVTDGFPLPYMTVDTRTKKTFSGGRYVETEGKGISGFGDRGSHVRALYLLDPLTYLPFLDKLTGGKTLIKTIRGN